MPKKVQSVKRKYKGTFEFSLEISTDYGDCKITEEEVEDVEEMLEDTLTWFFRDELQDVLTVNGVAFINVELDQDSIKWKTKRGK